MSLAIFLADDPEHRQVTCKVKDVSRADLVAALEQIGMKIIDVREVTSEYQPRLISAR